MKMNFLVNAVKILPNGRVIIAGIAQEGEAHPNMIATTPITKTEIVSISIVTPAPADRRSKLLNVRIHHGDAKSLEGLLLEFRG
jgi:hypothetical protein